MIKNPDSLLNKIPDLTDEHEKQIAMYFPQYAFYENKSKRTCDYFCTSCQSWHIGEQLRLCHNQEFVCGHCKESVKAKALHYGRKKLERSRKFGFCFAVDGRLYIRFVTAYQLFSDDLYNENPIEMLPEYTFVNEYLYIYEQHAMQRFSYDYGSFHLMKSDGIIPYTAQGLGWY